MLEPGRGESGALYEDYSIVFENFNTFRADVKLSAGKFYYELDIKHIQGVAQFGWATQGFNSKCSSSTFTGWGLESSTKSPGKGFESSTEYTGEGVGDNAFSWGFDGVGVSKWGDDSSSAFGVKWQEGDVLGLACDMVNKNVSFSVNGSFEPPLGRSLSTRSLPTPVRRPCRPVAASRWLPTLGTFPGSTGRPMRHTCPCTLRPRNRLCRQPKAWCGTSFSLSYFWGREKEVHNNILTSLVWHRPSFSM